MAQGIHSKWKCGRCNKWNSIDKDECTKCGSSQEDWAITYRDQTELTRQEETFYTGTAPQIANALIRIEQTLARIEELLDAKL